MVRRGEVLCFFDGRRRTSVAFVRVTRVDPWLVTVCGVPRLLELLVEREPEGEVTAGRV